MSGGLELVSIEIADYYGSMLRPSFEQNVLPSEFKLLQNSPNPFNPTTKISLLLPTSTDWRLDIYNVAGQLIRSYNGRGVGNVSVEWDASGQPSGVYFYKATLGGITESRKMLLLK
ncbi:MAG: T9SS type A sorting domain-containing protein [Candidatus Zixiibacteriota bacterium]